MAYPELVDFIKKQSDKGATPAQIEDALKENGWEAQDIAEGMSAAGLQAPQMPAPMPEPAAPAPAPAMPEMGQPMAQKPAAQPGMQQQISGPEDMFATDAQPQQSPLSAASGLSLEQVQPGATQPAATTMPPVGTPVDPTQTMQPDGQLADGSTPAQKVQYKDGLTAKGKLLTFGIIGAVITLIIVGIIYGYLSLYSSSSRITQNVINGLINTHAIGYTVEMQAVQGTGRTISLSGTLDLGSGEGGKAQSSFELAEVSSGSVNKTVSGELRYTGGKTYMKVDEIDAEEFAPIVNRWMQLGAPQLRQLATAVSPTAGAALTGQGSGWSEDTQNTVKEALQAHPFITIEDSVGETEISGVATTQYTFVINGTELEQFVLQLKDMMVAMGVAEGTIDGWASSARLLNGTSGNVWVDSESFTLYKIELPLPQLKLDIDLRNHNQKVTVLAPANVIELEDEVEATDEASAEAVAEEATTTEPTDAVVDGEEDTATEAVDADTDVEGIVPATDETAGDSDTAVLPDPTELVEPKVDKGPLDSDGDGLTDLEEEVLGTDPDSADTDLDGFNDKDEVDNGYNPLGPGRLDP